MTIKSPTKSASRTELLRSGSVMSSMFTLAKGTLGAGALSIPVAMHNMGLPLTLVVMALMAALTYVSIKMIAKAQDHCQKDTPEGIAHYFLGDKLGLVYDFSMIVFCFGTAVAYLIVAVDICHPVVKHFVGTDESDWYRFLLVNPKMFQFMMVTFVLLPLSLFKRINDLRYLTFTGVLCVLFMIVTVLYYAFRYGVSPDITLETTMTPKSFGGVVSAVSIFIFAFCTQPNVSQIYSEMEPRSASRLMTAVVLCVAMAGPSYLLIGSAGMVSFGQQLHNAEDGLVGLLTPAMLRGDVMIAVALGMMCLAVLLAYPLNIYPTRSSVMYILASASGRQEEDLPGWLGVLVVVATCYLSLGVAVALPVVDAVLGFVGAFAGAMICYIAPAACVLKMAYYPEATAVDIEKGDDRSLRSSTSSRVSPDQKHPVALYWAVFVLGWVLLIVGTYQATVDVIGL